MQVRQILTVAFRDIVPDAPVVGISAIAGRDIQHLVGTKADPVPVMVKLRPVNFGNNAARISIGHVGILCRDRIFFDGIGVVPPEHLA